MVSVPSIASPYHLSTHPRSDPSDPSDTSTAEGSGVSRVPAALITVRFGEFLREHCLITDEQWLAALALHWSEQPRRRIGDALVDLGFVTADAIERAAALFHDGLDVVEVTVPTTAPITRPRLPAQF